MTWTGSSMDAGYNLWSRYINGGSALSMGGGNDGTCVDYYFLFPGIWTYEFCVSAYNGNAESGISNCAIVPSPSPGFNPAPTCAAAPLHCPIPAAGSEGSPAPTTRQTGGPTGTPIGGYVGSPVTTITTTDSNGLSTTYVATPTIPSPPSSAAASSSFTDPVTINGGINPLSQQLHRSTEDHDTRSLVRSRHVGCGSLRVVARFDVAGRYDRLPRSQF
jgi:hypothetical protein